MKTVEGALRDVLLADDAVFALVGTRIYPQMLPEATAVFPCVTFWVLDDDPADENHEGSGGLYSLQIQISAWAIPTAAEGAQTVARKVAHAIREALLGRKVIVDNVELQAITGGRMQTIPPQVEADIWQVATDYDVIARING